MSVLLAGRPEGDAPFGDREAALLDAICDAVYPLIGTHLATEEDRSAHGLAPRLRETLDHVLLGLSEKQIAAEMELSRHTVHEYIMQLYRHFEVSGRAELLAYFVHRRPTSRGEVPSHRPVTSNRN